MVSGGLRLAPGSGPWDVTGGLSCPPSTSGGLKGIPDLVEKVLWVPRPPGGQDLQGVPVVLGYNTLHHAIDRPDQLVLPCPDAEEDIDFQEVQPAIPLGLGTKIPELQVPPVNPGSLEDEVPIEPSTTRSGIPFKPPEVLGGQDKPPVTSHGPDPGEGTCKGKFYTSWC